MVLMLPHKFTPYDLALTLKQAILTVFRIPVIDMYPDIVENLFRGYVFSFESTHNDTHLKTTITISPHKFCKGRPSTRTSCFVIAETTYTVHKSTSMDSYKDYHLCNISGYDQLPNVLTIIQESVLGVIYSSLIPHPYVQLFDIDLDSTLQSLELSSPVIPIKSQIP